MLTLFGVRIQVRPVLGVIVVVRATVPVNVPLAATVIVEVAAVPALTVTMIGFALRLMPGGIVTGILAVTVVELVIKF
jgi:hypothetical protein